MAAERVGTNRNIHTALAKGGREGGREGSDNLTSNAFIAHNSIHITANSPKCTKCARSQLFLSLSLASASTLYCMCVHVCYNNTSLSPHLIGWEQTPCLLVSLAATDGVICC